LLSYRLYRLDGAGKISSADWIQATDDEIAHAEARKRIDSGIYELWERDRLVTRIDASAA
jgi:hypothetical protein